MRNIRSELENQNSREMDFVRSTSGQSGNACGSGFGVKAGGEVFCGSGSRTRRNSDRLVSGQLPTAKLGESGELGVSSSDARPQLIS